MCSGHCGVFRSVWLAQTAVPNYGFGNYGNQNQNQNQFGFGNPSRLLRISRAMLSIHIFGIVMQGQQQNNWFNQPQQNSGLGNTQQASACSKNMLFARSNRECAGPRCRKPSASGGIRREGRPLAGRLSKVGYQQNRC